MRVRAVVGSVVIAVALGLLLCAGAGTIGWRAAWIWAGLFAVVGAIGSFVIPDAVLAERMRGPIRAGQTAADVAFVALFAPVLLGWFVVAGLDAVRFGWSSMPDGLRVLGIPLFVASNAIAIWVLRANPFASASVRVADDHRVVTGGPYRIVRHPMYASALLYLPGSALVLGSWVAFAASALVLVAFVIRIGIEERTLRADLPGYAEYAATVRWRLVPGVW